MTLLDSNRFPLDRILGSVEKDLRNREILDDSSMENELSMIKKHRSIMIKPEYVTCHRSLPIRELDVSWCFDFLGFMRQSPYEWIDIPDNSAICH